tara:strand:- start:141 stop:401 length:261 start_codon:yes stop_codon:yes gene_type:complete
MTPAKTQKIMQISLTHLAVIAGALVSVMTLAGFLHAKILMPNILIETRSQTRIMIKNHEAAFRAEYLATMLEIRNRLGRIERMLDQ